MGDRPLRAWPEIGHGLNRLARAAALGALLLRTSLAFAEPPAPQPATILLMVDVDDLTARRVAAEIRSTGLGVKSVASPPGTRTPVDIDVQSRSVGAAGAVDVDPSTREVRIWTIDPSKAEIVLRSVVALGEDSAVVALQVVEVLRATLSHEPEPSSPIVGSSREPAATERTADIHAPPAGTRSFRVAPPRFGATLGPAFAWAGGPFGESWEGAFSAYWLWTPRWGVEVLGAAPLTNAQRVMTAGTATLSFALAGGGIRARPLAASWCVLDVGAGIGAAAIRTQGLPNKGYSGTTATTWVALPYAKIAYAIPIAPPLWLQADVIASAALPSPNLTWPGEAGGHWGAPLVLGSVGMQVAFR